MDELKKIIALVFIKAYEEKPQIKTKTELARFIEQYFKSKNIQISDKSLLNYFNHFFGKPPKSFNPRNDIIDSLLAYINFQSLKQFKLNQPSNEDYLLKVPFSSNLKTTIKANKEKAKKEKFKNFLERICRYYLSQPKFNCIEIVGDIHQNYPNLDINDFFIDLSYIKKESVQNTNSLLKKEKANYSRILRRERLNISDKLAETVITSHKRSIILGNPGSGKSVFSRYLCHKWSKKRILTSDIFVHITLKELNFTKEKLCIPDYINETYFDSSSEELYSGWMFSEDTLFILDGFDEISNPNKKVLFHSLFDWVDSPKYVLLSRPYGILNQHISYDGLLEILGFNNQTRLKYIETLLDIKDQKSLTLPIISKLDSNSQLVDLSFNPLMLSYIIVVILEEGIEELKSIRSTYELQSKISGWLEDYYKTKPFNTLNYQKYLSKGEILAYEMELKQEYVFYRNLKNQKYDLVTDVLNQTGIGRKESFKNDSSWRFYFSSASFQEFLAAKAIIKHVTPYHIVHLLNNQLYWNFIRMIIGGLSDYSHNRVHEVLDYLYNKYEKESNQSLLRLYIILLAETPDIIVQYRIKRKLIEIFISCLQVSFEMEGWSKLILDSTIQIYRKLSFKQEKWFIEELINKLEDYYIVESDYNFDLLEVLLFRLKLHHDSRFVNSIMALIESLIPKYENVLSKLTLFNNQEPSEEMESYILHSYELQEESLLNIIGYSLAYMGKAPLDLLRCHISRFERISENIITFHSHTSVIIDRLKSDHDLEYEFTQMLNELKRILLINYSDQDRLHKDLKKLTPYHFGLKCVALSHVYSDSSSSKKNDIRSLIFEAYNLCKEVARLSSFDIDRSINDFLESLNILKPENYIEDLIALISFYDMSIGMECNDLKLINLTASQTLENYLEDTSRWDLFDKFFITLSFSENSDQLFCYYHNSFCTIILTILENYIQELDELYQLKINETRDIIYNHKAIIAIHKIINAPFWIHERQGIFNSLLNSKFINYNLVHELIMVPLIRLGLSATSKTVWKYIHDFSQRTTLKNILLLIDREDIYEYRSNYPEIIRLLDTIKHRININEFQERHFHSPYETIHYIFYRIGFLISRKFILLGSTLNKESKIILPILNQILLNPNFIRMRYNNQYGYLDSFYYSLFPLLMYEITGDDNIINSLELSSLYQNEKYQGSSFDFYQSAIELFGIQKLKENYSTIIGKSHIEGIINHQKEHIELFQSIDTKNLLSLVNLK